MAAVDTVFEQLGKMSVLELVELKKKIEDEWGITAAAKGRYIRQITIASTMSPGIHVDPTRTRGIVDDLEAQAETVSA